MTHDELRELVPVYALDAVEGDDRLEIQSHLESCPACRTSLEACLLAAGDLAMLAEPVTPPPALRTRLLQAVAESAQPGPAPIPIGRTARRGFTWRRLSAVVAVAAVLALTGVSFTLARHLNNSNRTIAQQREFLAALGSPLGSSVPLVGAGNAASASGVLYLSSDRHTARLVAQGLANPGHNIYQLWLITNNQPAPVEAFRPDSSGIALVSIRTNLAEMQAMAVTEEDHAGRSRPQGPFVLHS